MDILLEDAKESKSMNQKLVTTAMALGMILALVMSAGCTQQQDQEPQETRRLDILYVPTPQPIVDKMLEMARVKKDDLLYDLGCGDGRIVVTAAKKYGCKAIGYDIDPDRVKDSLENVRKSQVQHLVTIEQQDIFKLDLSEADVVTLYLLPELNERLIPQLQKLKPGSRIVSHEFKMGDAMPDEVVQVKSEYDDSSGVIYLWTTPLKMGSTN